MNSRAPTPRTCQDDPAPAAPSPVPIQAQPGRAHSVYDPVPREGNCFANEKALLQYPCVIARCVLGLAA